MNNSMPPSTPESGSSGKPTHRRSRIVRIFAWSVGALFVLVLLLALTATILLNSQRFHDYVLARVQQQATESLGVPVHLQNYSLNLAALSLDLYGLTVEGAAPYANPPLLQLDHAQASVRIVSIFQRKWYLDNVRLDRPIVRVYVDAHGVSNIPTIKSSGNSSSNTSIFDLDIRHTLLDNGEAYYNDRKASLDADLRNLDFSASFNPAQKQYVGHLSYSDGHLVSGIFKPIPHQLDATFDATPSNFRLTSARLASGPSQVNLTATLQNYTAPQVDLRYDAYADGKQVREILGNANVPAGVVHLSGTLQYQQVANRTLLDSLVVNGDLNSSQLEVNTPTLRARVSNLLAHYSLANGDANLQRLQASLLGGSLVASGQMTSISGDSHTSIKAALSNISLADAKRLAGSSAVPQNVAITGKLNAQATVVWGKSIDDLVANLDATVDGRVVQVIHTPAQPGSSQPALIPVNSAIHGTYQARGKQIQFKQSYLRTPKTDLTLNGLLSNRSNLNIALQCEDLREVETIADVFRQPTPGQPLQPLGLDGTASFQGAVQGSLSTPHLTGKFLATDFHVHGSSWKLLRTNIDASPSQASLQQAELQPASRGRITFNASTRLTQWQFKNTSPLQVQLDASQLAIAELAKAAGASIPVTGTLNASLRLHGTELNPVGNGSVALTNVVAYEEPIQSIKLAFDGTGTQVHGDLSVNLPAGNLVSKVDVQPQQKTYTAQVFTTGIDLAKLQALKSRNMDATGVLTLKASGQGSFDNPQGDAVLAIPQLVVQKQTISGLNLHLNVTNHIANANLTSSAVNTSIRANAKVNLTGDYLTDANLDTQAIPFAPLVAVYAPAQAGMLTGQTDIHATLHGPLKDTNQLEAHVTIPTLTVTYSNTIQLAAAAPIHVDYKDNVVQVQRSSIRGTDTDLQFQGSIPIKGNAPMSVLLQGTVDLHLAQLVAPDYRTSGQLKFNINSYGAGHDPNVAGQINIVNASVVSASLPVGLQHGNGVLTLTKDRLNVTSFQGTVGGGTLTAQGGVTYQPTVQFNLGLAAQGIRMLYPQGVRESVDANLRLTGSTEHALLGGSVNLSDLSFTPGFDLSSFINQFSGGVATPPTQGFSQNIALNLAVRSTNDVNLVSRTLSVGGSANLQVRGTAADPVILGRVNLNNGDIILNGSRFVLNGGTIQFVNPSETEPVVNVSLNTNIQQYSIYLRFNGPISQLRTEYSSDPSLPSADIINLLAFGKTTEASAQDATPANQAAESLIASQVSSQVTSRFSKIAGISQLSINPVLNGTSNQGLANITIQQRVTGNLFITFSDNVGSTQSQTIQGQYQISPRVAVSATRDQNGGVAFDALIKKSW